MNQKKSDEALSGGPIARKLVARMKRHSRGKAVDIGSWMDGRDAAEGHEEITAQHDMAGLDPAFAAYLYPHMQVSLVSEQLAQLKEMKPITDIVSRAEEMYMPEGPPMSPLTRSYFECWALFDACAGPANETIGTMVLELGAQFGMRSDLSRLIRKMQESRMGLYIYRGRAAKLAVLEDVVTGAVHRATVPSGYYGKKGELWYTRVLPPPTPESANSVVFITPYIVLHPGPKAWREYFQRTIPTTAPAGSYERHMKYGPGREYWNEYIFEAYFNHRSEAIFLTGLPDIPESRPHSRISEANGWKAPPS